MSKKTYDGIIERIPYTMPNINDFEFTKIKVHKSKFEQIIDRKIKNLRKQKSNGEQCEEYFYALIDEYIGRLKSEAENQHLKNREAINKFFRRRASDKIEFEDSIISLEEQIIDKETELEFVKTLYKDCNPLYNGTLMLNGVKTYSGDDTEEEDN
ncbi:MAG: hypothetical protein IJ062_11960 [Firmicutes bacterium]|nr:hypothetical protein [Bacillota bacterium]